MGSCQCVASYQNQINCTNDPTGMFGNIGIEAAADCVGKSIVLKDK
jgi:hypothetical protein